MDLCACVNGYPRDGEGSGWREPFWPVLFIIRVNRELKRVYMNGCRCNERLNTETEGSKTPRIHWVVMSVCDREECGRGEGAADGRDRPSQWRHRHASGITTVVE
jgi:hypothetical protein